MTLEDPFYVVKEYAKREAEPPGNVCMNYKCPNRYAKKGNAGPNPNKKSTSIGKQGASGTNYKDNQDPPAKKCPKTEVFKALNKTRGLYLRWQELSRISPTNATPDAEWTCRELKNALRSIEWDLEDLEDTIIIVEKNSSKFKIDNKEICDRRSFIQATKQEVQVMKSKLSMPRSRDTDGTAREPLLGGEGDEGRDEDNSSHYPNMGGAWTPKYTHYSRLENHTESPTRLDTWDDSGDNDGVGSMQRQMMESQDQTLMGISRSVGALHTVSKHISHELDDQQVMLDDLNTELENADSKLDTTIKKVAKVLHMNNDRRQWLAVGILVGLLIFILILFIIL